jgi:vitamin B12 transporter
MKFTKGILSGLIVCSSIFVKAQESLDTTVVSSNRLQDSYKETGKTVVIITSKDIEMYAVNTVEDLLQDVAGVNLNSRGGYGVQSDIGLRGSTFSQVLILVDNQRLNDGLTGHFNNNIPIALSEIDRIEIIKGPSGVSYGSDAVGGIIHIKTKTYTAIPKYQFNFGGKLAFGQDKFLNSDMGVFLNAKKWGFSGGVKALRSDGETRLNPNYGKNSVADSTYQSYFDIKNYTLSGVYMRDGWKAYLRGAMDVRDFDAKYFYTASSFDESVEQIKAYWIQSALINEDAKQRTEFNIGYKHNQDTFAFLPTAVNGHTTTRLNATLSQNRGIKKHKLAYGFQYDRTTIESSDRGDHNNFSIAGFAQTKFSFNDKFLMMLGVRAENDDYYGLQVVPQITATYILPKVVFRSSIGQSVRTPDYTERFVSYKIPLLSPFRNAGNPDVQPEKSFSADINANWNVSDKINISQSVFYRTSDNLIDYVITNSNQISNLNNLVADTSYFYTRNIANSQNIGYEMSAKLTFNETDSTYFKFMLDYTYLQTTNSDSVVSKYIANHPIHLASPRILFRYNRIRASLSSNLITRNPENVESINGEVKDQYVLMNMRISYKPKYVPARIFIEGRNILDTQYQEILGAQMPSRTIYAGFIWRWGEMKLI